MKWLQVIKMTFNCLNVARAFGIEPVKKMGKELALRCPIHGDEHPSLFIYPEGNHGRGVWKCFPCGIGGDRWKLTAFLLGCNLPQDYREVYTWLRERGFIQYKDRSYEKRKSQRGKAGSNKKQIRSG